MFPEIGSMGPLYYRKISDFLECFSGISKFAHGKQGEVIFLSVPKPNGCHELPVAVMAYRLKGPVWELLGFLTPRVCGRGNVFVVSVCLCVCSDYKF